MTITDALVLLSRRERSIALNAALFGAAVYVGYFGAGGGVLLLAVLGVMGG